MNKKIENVKNKKAKLKSLLSILLEKNDINRNISIKNTKRNVSYKIEVLFHFIGFVIFIFDNKLFIFKLFVLLILLSSSKEKLKFIQLFLLELNVTFNSYLIPHKGIIKHNEYKITIINLSLFKNIDNMNIIKNKTSNISLLMLSMKLYNCNPLLLFILST